MKSKLFFIIIFPFSAMALDLEKGIGITREIEEALWDTSIPYAIARQGQRSVNENQSVIAFVEQPNFIFSLSSDNYLLQTARTDRNVAGNWPLGSSDPCKNSANPDCVSPWWIGRWGADEVLEPEVTQRMTSHALDQKFGLPYQLEPSSTLGCFANNPLRYGDIEADGKKELVLITHDSFIVFSPEHKKTIFAFMFDNKDWVSWGWLIEEGLLLEDTPDSPQFGSLKLAEENKGTDIGYRGQAKIYVGNYETETSREIIVWRKFYQSRLKKDTVKGFEKIRDTYIHYKLINGEYKKQSTEQAVVKGWLESKNLTWQKGYPSKSECPGQEGQLIPEMHDPLLNDPDVLK
jgi:hypothetical protein